MNPNITICLKTEEVEDVVVHYCLVVKYVFVDHKARDNFRFTHTHTFMHPFLTRLRQDEPRLHDHNCDSMI